MARSIAGLDLQTNVIGHLQKNKFRVQEEEEWDHNNKIDFVVTKFPNYPKSISLGVQVTSACEDMGKRSEFVARNDPENSKTITVADKALYLEIEENVDMNRGGGELVASVLYAFQFDDRFAEKRVWAARLLAHPDKFSYRFYDPRLAYGAAQLPLRAAIPLPKLQETVKRIENSLTGVDRSRKGKFHTFMTDGRYGFIDAEDGSTYFMHIADVSDLELVAILEAMMILPGKTAVHEQVTFEDAGKTRPGATYRTAKNIRRAISSF